MTSILCAHLKTLHSIPHLPKHTPPPPRPHRTTAHHTTNSNTNVPCVVCLHVCQPSCAGPLAAFLTATWLPAFCLTRWGACGPPHGGYGWSGSSGSVYPPQGVRFYSEESTPFSADLLEKTIPTHCTHPARGGRLPPVLMRHPPQLSVKTGAGGAGWGGSAGGCRGGVFGRGGGGSQGGGGGAFV